MMNITSKHTETIMVPTEVEVIDRVDIDCASDDPGPHGGKVHIRARSGGRNKYVGVVLGTSRGGEVCISRSDFLAAAELMRLGKL